MDSAEVRAARQAVQALLRGVRTLHLYAPGHAQVQRCAEDLARRVEAACRLQEPLVLEIRAHEIACAGTVVHDARNDRDTLIARLFTDGVRELHLKSGFDPGSAERLCTALAPYCFADRAPPERASDRLHWEPFSGLTVFSDVAEMTSTLSFDALTAREQDWRHMLLLAPDAGGPLTPDAARPVWSGTGGRIPWPAPRRPEEERALAEEVDTANARGAPVSRVGLLLAEALRIWEGGPHAEALLGAMPQAVEGLLRLQRLGDLARLLDPALRWAADGEGAVRTRVRELALASVDEGRAERMLEDLAAARLDRSDLTALLLALPRDALPRILHLAALARDGKDRAALLSVLRRRATRDPAAYRSCVLTCAPGAALVALQAITELPPSPSLADLALAALDRPESGVRAQAVTLLLPFRSTEIAERIVPLSVAPARDVRSASLAWLARHAYRPAFATLRDLAVGGQWTGMDLPDRLEIARTLGVVGGEQARAIARYYLPTGWELGDLDRTLPWVVCLAATGSDDARGPLQALQSLVPDEYRSLVADAWALWNRRREAARESAEGGAPS
jgi:hypothetical protein